MGGCQGGQASLSTHPLGDDLEIQTEPDATLSHLSTSNLSYNMALLAGSILLTHSSFCAFHLLLIKGILHLMVRQGHTHFNRTVRLEQLDVTRKIRPRERHVTLGNFISQGQRS